MAGATKPTISRGITNPRKALNTELKVTASLAAHIGKNIPAPMPAAMAITTRASNPGRRKREERGVLIMVVDMAVDIVMYFL